MDFLRLNKHYHKLFVSDTSIRIKRPDLRKSVLSGKPRRSLILSLVGTRFNVQLIGLEKRLSPTDATYGRMQTSFDLAS